jgi:hypothetical protein
MRLAEHRIVLGMQSLEHSTKFVYHALYNNRKN